MALESLPKIAPALFSPEQDLIQIYNKKSDTLGVINASLIGGNTPPSGVSGAIQFSNGSAFASDSSNLFWNDTNNRLGIGTNAPVKTLNVVGGDVQIGSSLTSGNFNPATYRTFTIGSDYGSGALQIGNGTTGLMWGGLYANISNVAVYANSRDLTFETPVEAMRITSGRNVGIGETTPTSRLHIKGSGSTSATTSLLVQNSLGNNALKVRDDKKTVFGDSSIDCTITGTTGSASKFEFYAFNGYDIVDGYGDVLVTGLGNTIRLPRQVGIGFNTQNDASAILQADSTTKGFLPPRMTTTQINAISSPAEGLVAYNTTISHLCCYQAGAWVKLNHSPM